ncbi:MAG: 3-isopropylmalate dehydratase [Candidatus Thermoplasmatota archaeon]|nr:3-isopropylmalate dehydratase [Candidatus Thermoplasmatota archaeon]
MKPAVIKGRIWLITDENGKRLDDIDTDMIFHNRYLHITEVSEMGKHALGNLEGWKDFPDKAKEGDIIIAGKNFGAGSSRQQAVDCFISLGIRAIVAESFGAIYKRNAINSGLAVLECPGIFEKELKSRDVIEIDLETGSIKKDKIEVAKTKPMSDVQMEIYRAGNLFEYGKLMGRQ